MYQTLLEGVWREANETRDSEWRLKGSVTVDRVVWQDNPGGGMENGRKAEKIQKVKMTRGLIAARLNDLSTPFL